jgi:NADH:ubiquinone oxidoreductase subunit 6 (subunit J)
MKNSRDQSGTRFQAGVYVFAVALAFISVVSLVAEIASLSSSLTTLALIGGSMFGGVLAAAVGSLLGRQDEQRARQSQRAPAQDRRTRTRTASALRPATPPAAVRRPDPAGH